MNNKKLNYEELNKAAGELSLQNQRLIQENKMLNLSNLFKRMDYLFKVLEYADKFDNSFVQECADELKEHIVIPETKEENNNGTNAE